MQFGSMKIEMKLQAQNHDFPFPVLWFDSMIIHSISFSIGTGHAGFCVCGTYLIWFKRKLIWKLNIHPGEILKKEFLAELEISAMALSLETGIPESNLSQIIHDVRLSKIRPYYKLKKTA